ncbi:hypothetical protein TNCV_2587071 [Trichonephila clavipes]|nr:hypothetical protein TNCV_2587071 [Trichonephila clavipes]
MGCRLSFTIMAASLAVLSPRVQTINNDPMATCTCHFTAGGSIKSRDNRWVYRLALPNQTTGRVRMDGPIPFTPKSERYAISYRSKLIKIWNVQQVLILNGFPEIKLISFCLKTIDPGSGGNPSFFLVLIILK